MRMTWRERLADWISGGRFSLMKSAFLNAHDGYCDARIALADIAAMETPNANATVKRMARRAREALE